MTVLTELQKLFDEAGPLLAVGETRFESSPAFVTAYDFAFANLSARLLADSEFDTIRLVVAPRGVPSNAGTLDVSTCAPWTRAIGLEVVWAWALTNQQGYTDGLRLQFGLGEKGVVVELVVSASRLETFIPTRVLAPSNKPLKRMVGRGRPPTA